MSLFTRAVNENLIIAGLTATATYFLLNINKKPFAFTATASLLILSAATVTIHYADNLQKQYGDRQ